MEIKIKDQDQLIDVTIEVVDGVMIVSSKEEKWIPKDGDIVTYMNGDKATIYVFAGGCKYNTSFYVAYSGLRNKVFKISKGHLDMNRDDIRPATEEEKQKLFDKLKEEGYEFDFEKKELVKLRWKPKHSEEYHYPFFDAFKFTSSSYVWDGECFDDAMLNKGWVFPTKEECEQFCSKLNKAIEGVKP